MLSTQFLRSPKSLVKENGNMIAHLACTPCTSYQQSSCPFSQAQCLLPGCHHKAEAHLPSILTQQLMGCAIFLRLCTNAVQLSLCHCWTKIQRLHAPTGYASYKIFSTMCSTKMYLSDHPTGFFIYFLKISKSATQFSSSFN